MYIKHALKETHENVNAHKKSNAKMIYSTIYCIFK